MSETELLIVGAIGLVFLMQSANSKPASPPASSSPPSSTGGGGQPTSSHNCNSLTGAQRLQCLQIHGRTEIAKAQSKLTQEQIKAAAAAAQGIVSGIGAIFNSAGASAHSNLADQASGYGGGSPEGSRTENISGDSRGSNYSWGNFEDAVGRRQQDAQRLLYSSGNNSAGQF